jgi:3-phosphoshikimate 1-carboxyvinyltransferase
METGLAACGADVKSGEDWLRVIGDGSPPAGGARVKTHHDHRIAMSFLVLGLASAEPVEIDDASMIGTSFPNFVSLLSSLGADISAV